MAFNHIIVYEDRAEIRTSRCVLDGIITKDTGNTHEGHLWMSTVATGNNIVATLYKDRAGSSSVAVSDSVDVSDVDTTPAILTFSEADSSGITGTIWVHSFTTDVTLVPMVVSLCMDQDIEDEYARSEEAHMNGAYDATVGFARYCSIATSHVMRLVTQLYMNELGGFGGAEDYTLDSPDRLDPDWRGIIVPLQLLDAAKYYACWKIFMSQSESDGEDDMLAFKASQCKEQFDDAVSKISLTINTDPDVDEDADLSKRVVTTRMTRV